jgi:signal transduction histidine kinase
MECDRLEHLAETILAYQRAMSRDPRAAVQSVDVVRFIADLLAHRARTATGGEVETAVIDAVQVRADRDGLRVILENLLDNAHKYGGGHVRVSAGVDAGRWRLDISDSGRGFAPETAEKIFDLHHRGSGEGMTHGAGLGLAIARTLARRMGGDISARSTGPGHGAVFTVTLLVAPEASPSAVAQGAANG